MLIIQFNREYVPFTTAAQPLMRDIGDSIGHKVNGSSRSATRNHAHGRLIRHVKRRHISAVLKAVRRWSENKGVLGLLRTWPLMQRSLRVMMRAIAFYSVIVGAAMAETKPDLLELVRGGDHPAIASAIKAGSALELRDARGQTALLIATHANDDEAARMLIEAGADVNAKDAIQDSPYLYAGARGHLEILRLTLSHGADLKSTNRYGGTALIPASERGHVETVKTLIDAGVDINHVNNLGWTALLEAIILSDGGPKHVEIVKLLIDAGADKNIADNDGITPLQHAQSRGYRQIVDVLESK